MAPAPVPTAISIPMQVMTIVNMLLEDVAEKPERLKRAQEIAERDIGPLLTQIEERDHQLTELEAAAHELSGAFDNPRRKTIAIKRVLRAIGHKW